MSRQAHHLNNILQQAYHHPIIMGILNLTPDSFSDGGHYHNLDQACARALQMIKEGARIIDIGAESTRPGSQSISVHTELDRIMPLVEYLIHQHPDIALSVDTRKPQVMQAVIDVGVRLINDTYALQAQGAIDVIAQRDDIYVVLMHEQETSDNMQQAPHDNNIVEEVYTFLEQRLQICQKLGIHHNRIIVDPGIGFGKKTVAHNLALIKHLRRFRMLECPLLIGLSRKSTIGYLLNQPVEKRLYGSLAATVMAINHGAHLIRCHDVQPTHEAITITQAILEN